jgi:hypothetical protein
MSSSRGDTPAVAGFSELDEGGVVRSIDIMKADLR